MKFNVEWNGKKAAGMHGRVEKDPADAAKFSYSYGNRDVDNLNLTRAIMCARIQPRLEGLGGKEASPG